MAHGVVPDEERRTALGSRDAPAMHDGRCAFDFGGRGPNDMRRTEHDLWSRVSYVETGGVRV